MKKTKLKIKNTKINIFYIVAGRVITILAGYGITVFMIYKIMCYILDNITVYR